MAQIPVELHPFVGIGPFAMNAYLLHCLQSGEALLIDPGAEAPMLLGELRRRKIQKLQIFLTHAHLDHVLAVPEILERYPDAPLLLPSGDIELYRGLAMQCRMFGIPDSQPVAHFTAYNEGAKVRLGVYEGVVWHTPGHSPGSSCLYFAELGQFFGGDLIFLDGMGRVDLWGGDELQMQKSLMRLGVLPDSTRLYPGHGPSTTMGRERQRNPFLAPLLRQAGSET